MSSNQALLQKLVVAGVLAFAVGCGATKNDVPVEGVVTLDGQPMPNVQVLFDQPQTKGGNAFLGKTDEQGKYILKTVGDKGPGLTPGAYRVSLSTAFLESGARDDTPLPPEKIPAKYRDGKLKFDVPAGGTNAANFELKSRG